MSTDFNIISELHNDILVMKTDGYINNTGGEKIAQEFKTVFTVNDTPLYIGISIGISIYPQHGTTSQILQQRADVAMYVAKRNKTEFEIYDPKYDEYSIGKLSLISDLRKAIDENQ